MAGLNQYQEMSVNTATPMELVIMVYDECIRSLDRAEAAFKIEGPERIEKIGNNLLHAKDAITELSVSLDREQGGEIAENLGRLYDFMSNHLSRANMKKEIGPILEVKELMLELREAWDQVKQQEATSGPISSMPQSGRVGRINISG